jgi:hypothetical protein
MTFKKVVLKSCNPSEYPDLEITCRVLENHEIGEYLSRIPESKKMIGTKVAPVSARKGIVGEEINTVLKTVVEGREYILGEESGTVKERDGNVDIVVTNESSNSHESYIVKAAQVASTYEPSEGGLYVPARDPRVLTEVLENVIIVTAWGSEAICLQGSYIVTYNAEENDYNTLERGAKESTYETTPMNNSNKKLVK